MSFEWTEDRVEFLKTSWNARLSDSEIARRFGVSRNTVIGKRHRLGITDRRAPTPEEIEHRRQARLAKRRVRRVQQKVAAAEIARPVRIAEAAVLPPPSPKPIAAARMVNLLDLKADECHRVLTDRPPWLYCAAPADPEAPVGPYCPRCLAEIYQSRAA